jgi:RNA polymerase sigma-70 factor (ECF subfamily)
MLALAMVDPLSDLALARLYRSSAPGPAPLDDAALGAALRRLFEEGERAWPGVGLAVEAFVSHLARRATGSLPHEERGPDLYLTCACAQRARGALEAFDRAHLARMDAYLVRLGPTPAFVDEVRQEVRDKLYLDRDGAGPRIAEYDGRGALASWVRVIATRTAIDLRRKDGAATDPEERAGDAPAAADPERDYQRARYQRAFDEALRGAVAALDSEQRRILRRHFADGVSLDALAVELGMHRTTVGRHLAAASKALRRDALRRLQSALGGTGAEVESLVASMRSRLDLSLPGLLRTQ